MYPRDRHKDRDFSTFYVRRHVQPVTRVGVETASAADHVECRFLHPCNVLDPRMSNAEDTCLRVQVFKCGTSIIIGDPTAARTNIRLRFSTCAQITDRSLGRSLDCTEMPAKIAFVPRLLIRGSGVSLGSSTFCFIRRNFVPAILSHFSSPLAISSHWSHDPIANGTAASRQHVSTEESEAERSYTRYPRG